MSLTEYLEIVKSRILSGKWKQSQIAKGAGVDRYTIRKIASGETPNPGIMTVEKIYRFTEENN
ncbi:hypothetical protein [Zhongshania sp.]|uniref:hypothetical protein n=1 Tax=Zhongshania sp. TaxID=1971902 RepID=UPI00356433D3